MGIHVIVDGYNLLYSHFTKDNYASMEVRREELIGRLQEYAVIKRFKLTVVFDGWKNGSQSEYKEDRKNIRIIYSRLGETADDYISKMAKVEKDKAVVITCDNGLADRVKNVGSSVVKCQRFMDRVDNSLYEECAGCQILEKDVDFNTRKKGPSKRLSRRKRSQTSMVRKL